MACLVLTMRDIADCSLPRSEEVVQMPEVREEDLYYWLNGFLWLAFADLYFFFHKIVRSTVPLPEQVRI